MRHILTLLLALSCPASAFAQDNVPPIAPQGDPCSQPDACRTIGQLRVEGPQGNVTMIDMGMTMPWLTQGNVMLTPGEAVTISLTQIDDVLVPAIVSTGAQSRNNALQDGQIRFDLGGYDSGRLILSVLSYYHEPLDYGALKVTVGLGPERTSVCTLSPGIGVFETWQEPIYQMALFGFRPAGEDGCKIVDENAALSRDTP